MTLAILEDVCNGRSPLIFIDRFRNYCTDVTSRCDCKSDSSKGQEIVGIQRECHVHRLGLLLLICRSIITYFEDLSFKEANFYLTF
ncbi:meiotic recombination protein SPO11-1-like [Impatiens glandulifera]|uniref:meiotic recombination protein SPO11-1-like n=1 Tax=Impatiens glandulifera TaxID=253017 RepID=UPI001FB0813C|nr:meiotic recombination protein SPO11-1-like [Impatiens glandulifera]